MVRWSFWQVSHSVVDFLRRPCGADPRIAVRWSPWALCQRTLPIWTWRRAWKWIWLYQVEVHHVAKSCAKQNKIRKNHMQRFGFVQVKCGRAHSRRWCFPTIYLLLSQCTGLLCLWSLVMVELGRMGGALGGWILAAYDSLAVFKCLRKMGRGNTSSSARSWAARITEQLYFCAAHRRANRPYRLS